MTLGGRPRPDPKYDYHHPLQIDSTLAQIERLARAGCELGAGGRAG